MGTKGQRHPDPIPGAAPSPLPPAAPTIFIEDLSSDDFKAILKLCGDEVISPLYAGVKARTTPAELAQRFNSAWNQGGHSNGANDYAPYSPETIPIAGLQQAGVVYDPATVFYAPTQQARAFVTSWKGWAAEYGPGTGHGNALKSVQGLVDAANAVRAALGKKPMQYGGGKH